MKTAFSLPLMLGIASTAFAGVRTSQAPQSITVTVSGITGNGVAQSHNGTFKLFPEGRPGKEGTWIYSYYSNPQNPSNSTTAWGITVDENNQVWLKAGAGQFPVAIGGQVSDIYFLGSLQVNCGQTSTTATIKANP